MLGPRGKEARSSASRGRSIAAMSQRLAEKVLNTWTRKLHRWGAILIALPVGVIVVTGLLLQVKKHSRWVQPPELHGSGGPPQISFAQILEIVRGVPEAGIDEWADVDRIDVRPGRGMLKVRNKDFWEVQIDTSTGAVLQSAFRRSDLIETIHDGSWFHDSAKLWVFLPTGAVLLGLWMSGLYLWALPIVKKRAGRQRAATAAAGHQA
jgi:uncharacterized iron-regulated membrane protein